MPHFQEASSAVDRKSDRTYGGLSGRVRTMIFCFFPVFCVAVMEKCCDECAQGDFHFQSSCSAPAVVRALGASTAVYRKLMGHTALSGRGKTATPCDSAVFSVAVMEKCCDACGDGEYYFRSSSSATEDVNL
jgi:hypothetical protein